MKRTARAKGIGKPKWLEVFERLQEELRDGVYPQEAARRILLPAPLVVRESTQRG